MSKLSIAVTPSHSTTLDIVNSLDEYQGDFIDWLNALVDGEEELEGTEYKPVDLNELDQHVSDLATRLEVACQNTSSQLERSIEDISRNVPRLNYDLQFMRESAITLQLALHSIHEKQNPNVIADEETIKALEQLQFLDSVKKGMEAAHGVLQEAENWSTLESEVTSLLKEASYDKAAERLAEASNSMAVFQNTAEYDTRRTLMINLQNQLEAALSAALVAAINTRDITSCKGFHTIFINIQREPEFRNYYFGARRREVVALWSNAQLSDVQGENIAEGMHSLKLSELLARFFGDFVTLLNEERAYSSSIFTEPATIISLFIQTTIESLTPSFSQRLSGLAEFYGPETLPELIKAFKLAEDFAGTIEKLMERITLSNALTTGRTSSDELQQGKGHSRRQSKRISMSRRMISHRPAHSVTGHPTLSISSPQHSWVQPLFEPFLDFQSDYLNLEKRLLEEGLRKIYEQNPYPSQDPERQARVLREQSMDVFSLANDSIPRCIDFTHGYGARSAVEAVDHLLITFLERAKSSLMPDITIAGHAPIPSSESFEESLLSQEDLTAFQLALNLLNTCRSLKERCVGLDVRYRTSIVQISQTIRAGMNNPGAIASKGILELLSQSTLNSLEFSNLLDAVDPQPPASSTPFLTTSFNLPPTPTSASAIRSDPPTPAASQGLLLQGSHKAITDFAQSTQGFLQQVILTPLFQQLEGYPSLPVWSSNETKKRAPQDLAVPTFSRSATPIIQRVLEGLMTLPSMFEDYVTEDDALFFSLETLPFIELDASLKEILEPAPILTQPTIPGSPRAGRLSSPSARRLSLSSPPIQTSRPAVLTAEMVSSAWISSITLSLLSHLTTQILPQIRSLSIAGAAQLAYDLNDLANFAGALNAEWDALERWKEYCELSNEEGRQRYLSVQGANGFLGGQENIDVDGVLKQVAKIRGWSQ